MDEAADGDLNAIENQECESYFLVAGNQVSELQVVHIIHKAHSLYGGRFEAPTAGPPSMCDPSGKYDRSGDHDLPHKMEFKPSNQTEKK
jgi:hypothetical protein